MAKMVWERFLQLLQKRVGVCWHASSIGLEKIGNILTTGEWLAGFFAAILRFTGCCLGCGWQVAWALKKAAHHVYGSLAGAHAVAFGIAKQ